MSRRPAGDSALLATVGGVLAGTGLDLTGCHRRRVVAAVAGAMKASGADDAEELARCLRADPALGERLLDDVTVSETYFLREPGHLRLVAAVASDRRSEGRPLRVWSAGCASGEEAYSVAITLADAGVLDQASIIGTDLNERSLAQARRAVYRSWSLRRCTQEQRARWFVPDEDRFRLRDRYRRSVGWRRMGLLEGGPPGSFDVVLCRNVLIYLTDDAIGEVAAALHDSLAPDGWLLLGAADPLLRHPGLVPVLTEHGLVYRRVPVGAVARSTGGEEAPEPVTPARRRRSGAETGPPRNGAVAAVESSAHRLVGSSNPAERSDDGHELDATARCRSAAQALEEGRLAEAAAEAAAALYLDPTMVAAHLLLGQSEERAGDHDAASRRYRNALGVLAELDPAASVHLLEEPVGQLIRGVFDRISSLQASS